MKANAEKLGKKKEFEAKFAKVNEELARAQEFYDNLSVAIMILREDVKTIPGGVNTVAKIRQFSAAHEEDSPEDYLSAIQSFISENPNAITGGGEQIEAAAQLLAQANENLAAARTELEAINREMLMLTQ